VEAAGGKWEQRRVETTQRLERCALELTLAKGFDGWTMDDLAAAAEVSRRTVFNYFDSKADVVLGPEHDLSEETVAGFVAGGPTGRLFDDFVHLAAEAMQDNSADLEVMRLRRDVWCRDGHVITIAHERFEEMVERAVDLIRQREGKGYDAARARLLVRLLVTIFDSVVERTGPDLARSLPDLINEAVGEARALLID
jgi:AcrR family transcriptional regulator